MVIHDRLMFHISDEPKDTQANDYAKALSVVKEYLAGHTVGDALSLVRAGADIVAFDGTQRPRPDSNLYDIIKYIKINKRLTMADISTFEEGMKCKALGADILSTTLSGYTLESGDRGEEPDFELLEKLVNESGLPVVLEGRIWEPEQVAKAFELGAHCVVIGSAITRPHLITKRFIEAIDVIKLDILTCGCRAQNCRHSHSVIARRRKHDIVSGLI